MAYSFSVDHNGVDISANVEWRMALTYGRGDPSQQPSPATLSLAVVYNGSALTPADFQLGDLIEVTVSNTGQTDTIYFRGTITNARADHDTIRISCTSDVLGSLSRTLVDVAGYTATNLQTVLTAVTTAATTAGSMPGVVNPPTVGTMLYEVTTTAQTQVNALSYLQQLIASEPEGVVLEQPGYGLTVAGYDDRRISTMPAAQKFNYTAVTGFGWEWTVEKNAADFRNKSSVTYSAGTATYQDSASVTSVGPVGTTTSTALTNLTDADFMALRLVQHGLNPGWRTTGLVLNCDSLTDAQRKALAANMRTGSYLQTPTISSSVTTEYFVEGWADDIGYNAATGATRWLRTLNISDITSSQAAQRYIDVVSGVTWGTVNPAYRWVDLEQLTI